MSLAPALRIEGLERSFGPFTLGPLSLEVERGAYWVLLGPSGCGKSMLLETLSGFHRPRAGSVWLGEREATREPPERRNIGLVFQKAALFPHLSVRRNIGYGLEARREPEVARARRIDEVVMALGLEGLVERPVTALSGGEAQRVAIARALAPRPSVLLLDEPLSLLDHNTRLELQGLLSRWHRELGLTTLHVTHSREEARSVGTHCAIMRGGTLVQAGRVSEVFERPRCPFVAGFLGVDAERAQRTACADSCSARCGEPWAPGSPVGGPARGEGP